MATKKKTWPSSREELYQLGIERAKAFCRINHLPIPAFRKVDKEDWHVNACAFYRPEVEPYLTQGYDGINICLQECGYNCSDAPGRNWSWPGSTTDREPYGVVCHELGHHVDWCFGDKKGTYWSDYGASIRKQSREPPITSYCPNDAEWFAEMCRLYITNPDLLRQLRPKTYRFLSQKVQSVGPLNWRFVLGTNVPNKVIRTLMNKGAV